MSMLVYMSIVHLCIFGELLEFLTGCIQILESHGNSRKINHIFDRCTPKPVWWPGSVHTHWGS